MSEVKTIGSKEVVTDEQKQEELKQKMGQEHMIMLSPF